MTFGQFKAEGGSYDYKVFANNPGGGFGHKGGTIYGQPASIDEWIVDHISIDGDIFNDNYKVTVFLIDPMGEQEGESA